MPVKLRGGAEGVKRPRSSEVAEPAIEVAEAALKLVEILNESKAASDDKRQRLLSAFAQSAEGRAKANSNETTLLAKYEKTRAYRSAIAEKGAKTRKKNEALAEEAKKAEEAKSAALHAPRS